ncbi:prepilin-type N-terminal cleavage/methylation domain-containing protein [Botrimarina sp.]|uniref:prepilin-type N-terminal cleavage/methylation domain-containing protein n=1 Tax=Botrimarina sp. TaxID=2795802 RepID=UPI0032EC928F
MRQETKKRVAEHHSAFRLPHSAFARHGFTLVELLVVITIIAILAGLLLAAAGGALGAGAQARITTDITQITTALEDYNNNVGSYPPNAQTNPQGGPFPYLEPGHAKTLQTFKRHFKQAFPSHREPDALLAAMVGLAPNGTVPNSPNPGEVLVGGMNAAESLVFWLGGFSQDPKYPISGPGGPSYTFNDLGTSAQEDPIENRAWTYPANVQNLGPRTAENFFDQTDNRFIVYSDPRNPQVSRRINFWYLKPSGSPAPYLYFDTSRSSSAIAQEDPPASTIDGYSGGQEAAKLNELVFVHAIKALKEDRSAPQPFKFANDNKFQLLHPGVDEDWGELPVVNPTPPSTIVPTQPAFKNWLVDSGGQVLYLYYPVGPWTLELADTLTNFADGTLADAQEE